MSTALFTNNNSNGISIDSTLRSYVYLGKIAIPETIYTGVNRHEITFGCVGYPTVFIDLPYGATAAGDGAGVQVGVTGMPLTLRYGAAVVALRGAGTNQWTATVLNNVPPPDADGGGTPPVVNAFIRVFGRLDLNYPAGSSDPCTVRSWSDDGSGALIFDGGYRMLKLAGATYAAQATLAPLFPGYNGATDAVTLYDTAQDLGFNLAGKSICCNARMTVFPIYEYGTHTDVDTGQTVHEVYRQKVNTLFWANGNALYARKVSYGYIQDEIFGSYFQTWTGMQASTTRIAILDNSRFP